MQLPNSTLVSAFLYGTWYTLSGWIPEKRKQVYMQELFLGVCTKDQLPEVGKKDWAEEEVELWCSRGVSLSPEEVWSSSWILPSKMSQIETRGSVLCTSTLTSFGHGLPWGMGCNLGWGSSLQSRVILGVAYTCELVIAKGFSSRWNESLSAEGRMWATWQTIHNKEVMREKP